MDTVFQVSRKRVKTRRLKAAAWGGVLLALATLASLWSAGDILAGERDWRILAPLLIGYAGTALVLLDGALLNPFGITTSGFYPPKRRLSKMFSRADWFVPFKDIRRVDIWEDPKVPGTEGRPFGFEVEVRRGRPIRISPVGGFGALGRYVTTEREMIRAYKLLKVVAEELNRPETQARAEMGQEIVIPKERFEPALA